MFPLSYSPGSHFGPHGNTNPAALSTWVVEADLPPHPGFGLRRPPPSWEALRPRRRGACPDSEAVGKPISENRDTGPGNAPPESGHGSEDPWACRRAALRGHLARARSFRSMIDRAVVANAAEIAAREELTRARVSQLLRLLDLAPDVLADLEDPEGTGAVPAEAILRKLAGIKSPERQSAEYRRLCAAEAASRAPRSGTPSKGRPPQRGLQHLFERARRYHALLESGEARSLEDLGRAEGVTGRRISQILRLLQLAPEIIEAVDVPAEELPAGVTERRLREVAKLWGREEQMAAWRRCLAAPRG